MVEQRRGLGQRLTVLFRSIMQDSGIEDPVLFQSEGGTRIFKLNNPKAYNALNGKMVDLMTPKIKVRSSVCLPSMQTICCRLDIDR